MGQHNSCSSMCSWPVLAHPHAQFAAIRLSRSSGRILCYSVARYWPAEHHFPAAQIDRSRTHRLTAYRAKLLAFRRQSCHEVINSLSLYVLGVYYRLLQHCNCLYSLRALLTG